ncbi:5,10-methylenetetrahydrofolate reductase [Caulifigura coniformis]|uniref:Methylenetetrahydrofolate reductase n=1 Tax=Caulifigura coniformis TaxID=2527983 RepID=A0A517SI32_9PLAN|nr:methylenetetrahydrofolate reductase [NAD(P)H] [Caulifigura coniformis]QDT55783.1 5,10-methylenetetrahydrofolate reductase [Caulifigura coniformis]
MNIRDAYGPNRFGLSFEVFPPKSLEGDRQLATELEKLAECRPAFISCTYGAGGSTSKRTLEWCGRIQQEFSTPAMAHLTCLNSTADSLKHWMRQAFDSGINNLMVLRGDLPRNASTGGEEAPGGLRRAHELVTLARELSDSIGIGVAGYPEKHPESPDDETDLLHLGTKVRCGADAVFTQLFFDNRTFLAFRDRAIRAGIQTPIVPGIMPVTEYDSLVRISSLCGSVIPDELQSGLEAARHDPVAQFEFGVDYAIQQCRDLIRHGVPGIHFYVLNKAAAVRLIVRELLFDARDLSPIAGRTPGKQLASCDKDLVAARQTETWY